MREPACEVFHAATNKVQRLFAFPNGYGASVVRVGTEETWELVVIRFYGPNMTQFDVQHNHQLSGKRFSESAVDNLLAQIERLSPPIESVPKKGTTN